MYEERRGVDRIAGDKSPCNARRGGGVKGGAAAEGHPSRQSHSAHHTEHVTVHYPWHPLHGQTILVQRSVRHGREVWLCDQPQRTAAIPVWMTDCVACAALSVGPVLVSVEALIELALLMTAIRSARTIASPILLRRSPMRRRQPRQMPIPFERELPAVVVPAPIAQDLVKALADLLLASAGDAYHDEERDDAREDHR